MRSDNRNKLQVDKPPTPHSPETKKQENEKSMTYITRNPKVKRPQRMARTPPQYTRSCIRR